MIIGEDESKLIPFGRGELDGLRCCSAVYIHTQAYCLVFSFQPTNTVASYCGSPLTFPRNLGEEQVMVLEHPLRIQVMCHDLLAHCPLQQPLAGEMIEQR